MSESSATRLRSRRGCGTEAACGKCRSTHIRAENRAGGSCRGPRIELPRRHCAILCWAKAAERFCAVMDSGSREMMMDFEAVWLSVQLAAWTMVILFVLGLPLAYWLASTRWRFKFLLEAL